MKLLTLMLFSIVISCSSAPTSQNLEAENSSVQVLPMLYPGSQIFIPKKTPAPGILMLHGSEGGAAGVNYSEAYALAQKGFVIITYCYYRCYGTPSRLHRISLDGVISALEYLKSSPYVNQKKVGLFGVSRGAEKSLLLASLLKSTRLVSAVAVHAPSHTVVAAFDPLTQGPVYEPIGNGYFTFGPAWTYKGFPLFGERYDFSVPGPAIAVADYDGPMLLSHGTADEVWPSLRSKKVRNLRDSRPALQTELLLFPGEKHILTPASEQRMRAKRFIFFAKELGLQDSFSPAAGSGQ